MVTEALMPWGSGSEGEGGGGWGEVVCPTVPSWWVQDLGSH